MTPRLLRGSVPARAVWLDPSWTPPAALRRQALALWERGAIVQELDGGLLVRFPAPRRTDCALAPGLPYVEGGDGLWAWAPTPEELAAAAPGSLHRLRGGLAESLPLASLPDAELWRHLEVDAPLAVVAPLGPPPPPLPVPVVPDTRARMGRPPADPAAVAIQEELARRGAAPVEVGWLARAAAGLLAWLDRRKQAAPAGAPAIAGAGAPATAGNGAPATAGKPGPPPGPGWLESLARRFAAPLLAPMLDRRHGRYFSELLDLFEKNDLDAALRRAIPLGGGGGGPALPPPLGLPTPRTSLALSGFRPSTISSSIGVDDQLLKILRDTYQRAIDKLVAEGRVEDAAFVLVELLREHKRAVELLEKHGKWALAAEIAEAAEMGPEVVVRLWAKAGQLDRAIRVARRTASFAACLPIVEAADADRGRAFRAAWAAHLAAGGDPAAAVGICWPVELLRPLALRWLDDALREGGIAGVRLLPLRLVAEPGRFDEVRAAVEPLLAGDGPEDRALRVALAEGLTGAPSPGAKVLARPLLRRLVADQAAAPAQVSSVLAYKVRELVGDPALAADLPLPVATPPLGERGALRWNLDASDRGSAPVLDLAVLPRGRLLLALGEAGCRVVDRAGRVLAVLDEPAEALVLHDSGRRAIAVARRDGACRMAHLDLEAGTATRWIEAPMGDFARTYDGSLWFVADGHALLALDPLAERPTTLWRVDTGGPVTAVTRGEAGLYAVVGGKVRQVWRYALPNLRLTERAQIADDDWAHGWLGGDGAWVETPATAAGAVLPTRAFAKGASGPAPTPALPVPEGLTGFRPTRVERHRQRLLVAGTHDRGAVVSVLDLTSHDTRLHVALSASTNVVARLGEETLALADDLGRAELIDLRWGKRVVSARV